MVDIDTLKVNVKGADVFGVKADNVFPYDLYFGFLFFLLFFFLSAALDTQA
jgi:hypothetical protein